MAALTLGLAAGSLGLGPGQQPHDGFFDPDYLEHRGGAVGELLFWATRTLFQEIGAHLLFLFLLVAGGLLLTGGSIAGIARATRAGGGADHRSACGGALRSSAAVLTGETPVPRPQTPELEPEPSSPPEVEPVVRATHVEAPALDASERYPDLYGQSPRPSRDPSREPPEVEEPVEATA